MKERLLDLKTRKGGLINFEPEVIDFLENKKKSNFLQSLEQISKEITNAESIDDIFNLGNDFFKVEILKQIDDKGRPEFYSNISKLLFAAGIYYYKLGYLVDEQVITIAGLFEVNMPRPSIEYYAESTIYFQNVLSISKSYLQQEEQNNDEAIWNQLNSILNQLVPDKVRESSAFNLKSYIFHKKSNLSFFREHIKKQVEEISGLIISGNDLAHWFQKVKDLHELITSEMSQILASFYDQAIKIYKYNCNYVVIGHGSMSLKQITPYSDYEYSMISERKSNSQEMTNLSHLVHFFIINLGETIIPTSRYDTDLSFLVQRGICNDLGGKTPFGRIDREYSLIQDIEGMLKYVRDENNEITDIDKCLAQIVSKGLFVYGNRDIFSDYYNRVKEFLQNTSEESVKRKNCEIRALKYLQEGANKYICNNNQKIISQQLLRSDLEAFRPLMKQDDKFFDVKQEFYRLPERLIYNLGLYYEINEGSCWDIIKKLKEKEVITDKNAIENLSYLISYAAMLRLEVYCYYRSKNDRIAVLTEDMDRNIEQLYSFNEAVINENENGAVFKFFHIAQALHKKLKEFCAHHNMENTSSKFKHFFQNHNFYEANDFAVKGLVYYRLRNYDNALSCLKEAMKSSTNQDDPYIRFTLGKVYFFKYQFKEASDEFSSSIDSFKALYRTFNPNINFVSVI